MNERRQDEQAAGDEATPRAVQQPADVGGELLGLRARQHHAVQSAWRKRRSLIQRRSLDQLAVHHRDLAGRTAEADETQLEPEAGGLAEAECGFGAGA